jgi:hypothetical protein
MIRFLLHLKRMWLGKDKLGLRSQDWIASSPRSSQRHPTLVRGRQAVAAQQAYVFGNVYC